jgi:hypothetical protein
MYVEVQLPQSVDGRRVTLLDVVANERIRRVEQATGSVGLSPEPVKLSETRSCWVY